MPDKDTRFAPPREKPLIKITTRGVREHFGRFLMTLLAVAVATAFLSGVLGLRDALNGVARSAAAAVAVHDIYVVGPAETTPGGTTLYGPVNANLANIIESVPQSTSVQPLWRGTGLLYDRDGNLVQTSGGPVIFTTTVEGNYGPSWLEGQVPEKAGEIALEQSGANRINVQIGDKVEIALGGEILPQQVVGFYAYENSLAGVVSVSFDPTTATELLGESGEAPAIAVNLEPGAERDAVANQIRNLIGPDDVVLTQGEYRDYLSKQVDFFLGFLTTFILVFIAIALFVSTFIIFNTFQMTVRARQKEFALLRAIGTGSGQVFWVVATQAILIGLIGGAAGVGMGYLLTLGAEQLLARMGFLLDEGIPFTLTIMGISLTVGVVVTVVSALLPARQAARTPPVQAMRSSDGANERFPWLRSTIGFVLTIIGVLGIGLGANRLVEWDGIAFGAGAVLLLLGLLIAAPSLVLIVVAIVGWPIRLLFPNEGRLAMRNLTRNPRRTSATAGALLVGVTLVSAGGVLATSVKESISSLSESQLLADFIVQSADPFSGIPEEVTTLLGNVEGVGDVHADIASGMVSLIDDQGQTKLQTAAVIPEVYFGRDIAIPLADGSLEGFSSGQVILTSAFADQEGLVVGSTVTLRTSSGQQTRTVGALVDFNVVGTNVILSPTDEKLLQGQNLSKPAVVFVWVEGGADVAAVKLALQEEVKPLRTVLVGDAEDAANSLSTTVDQVLTILYALLGLSIFVAALGIINTLSLSVAERTREFGLLRAIGMKRTRIAVMVVIESILTAVFGTVVGVLAGTGLAATLQIYLREQGLTVLSIPWVNVAVLFVAAIVLGVTAAIIPAVRASRIPVLEAIASE